MHRLDMVGCFPKCGLVSICCWVSISFKWWQQMQNNSFFAVFETWSLLDEYKHVAHAWLSLYTFASRHRFPMGLTNNLIIEPTHANNRFIYIYIHIIHIYIYMYKIIWQYTSYISLRLNTSRISRPQASTSCVFNFTLAVDSLENSGCSCFTAWGMRTGETAEKCLKETSISLASVFTSLCRSNRRSIWVIFPSVWGGLWTWSVRNHPSFNLYSWFHFEPWAPIKYQNAD